MNAARKVKMPEPWHPADIKAALAKKGWTFAMIAREYGYPQTSPNVVLKRTWAAMERIVADIIGVDPKVIWPDRYTPARRFRTRRK